MKDRELLEKAARAAGYEIHVWGTKGAENFARMDIQNYPRWNPLTDDGDALRLAVKLNLFPFLEVAHSVTRDINGDPYAATRRAIVRAAAAIGETL